MKRPSQMTSNARNAKAFRLREKQKQGKPMSKEEGAWLIEFNERYARKTVELPLRPGAQLEMEPTREPTKVEPFVEEAPPPPTAGAGQEPSTPGPSSSQPEPSPTSSGASSSDSLPSTSPATAVPTEPFGTLPASPASTPTPPPDKSPTSSAEEAAARTPTGEPTRIRLSLDEAREKLAAVERGEITDKDEIEDLVDDTLAGMDKREVAGFIGEAAKAWMLEQSAMMAKAGMMAAPKALIIGLFAPACRGLAYRYLPDDLGMYNDVVAVASLLYHYLQGKKAAAVCKAKGIAIDGPSADAPPPVQREHAERRAAQVLDLDAHRKAQPTRKLDDDQRVDDDGEPIGADLPMEPEDTDDDFPEDGEEEDAG